MPRVSRRTRSRSSACDAVRLHSSMASGPVLAASLLIHVARLLQNGACFVATGAVPGRTHRRDALKDPASVTARVALPRLHSSHAVTRLSSLVAPPATRGMTWSTCSTTPGALPGRPQYRHRKPSRCRMSKRIRARIGALRVRRPPVGPSEFVRAAASLRCRRSIRPGANNGPRLLAWSAQGPFERRLGTRLRSMATRGATIARSPTAS
jgi:hypothetical protein